MLHLDPVLAIGQHRIVRNGWSSCRGDLAGGGVVGSGDRRSANRPRTRSVGSGTNSPSSPIAGGPCQIIVRRVNGSFSGG